LLGIGGMAWVHAATHKNLHRVAIKMLLPEPSRDPKSRERFLREGYVANAVDHPGAVSVFDDDCTVFLVMELLDGADLNARCRARGGRIDPATALQVADAVLDVLVAAHAKQIVHRDIEPGNVFITREGSVKVLDFGIARVREQRSPSDRSRLAPGGRRSTGAPICGRSAQHCSGCKP
jgi:serine/threonine-protein kinase